MSTEPVAPADLPPLERARRTETCEYLCLAGVHALTGLPHIRRRGRHWYAGSRPVPVLAPSLHPLPETDGTSDFRGAADGVAAHLSFTDEAIYADQAPEGVSTAALVFAVLEQVRVEALLPRSLPGLRRNVARRHQHWVRQFLAHGLGENERALHVLAVDLTARVHVLGAALEDDLADLLEGTRWGLAGAIGADMRSLRRLVDDQHSYGLCARRIADAVAARLESSDAGGASDEDDDAGDDRGGFSLLIGFETDDAPVTAGSGRSRTLTESSQGYRVFTSSHDTVEPASQVARASVLQRHRSELDELIRDSGVFVPGLARRLQALLSAPAEITWADQQESGVIDARRLAGLVTRPNHRQIFRRPASRQRPCTSVTLLLDLSGSMRTHQAYVGVLVDTVCRALDRADIVTEVLGFTTTSWQGGPARAEWLASGRPPAPGRLAATRHVILKDARSSWRRSRDGLAAMLHSEVYKEGVDGEALAWAAERAAGLDTERHLVVVLSDGSPSERSTALANDEHYLGQHLRDVADQVSARPGFGLVALGLGLDLSPYYDRSRVVHDTQVASVHTGIADLLSLCTG